MSVLTRPTTLQPTARRVRATRPDAGDVYVPHAGRSRWLNWLGILLPLVLAAFCLLRGLAPTTHATKPIEQIAVGERVVAENPTGERDLSLGLEVDPATWRQIELRAPKADGTWADVTLLRPARWLEAHRAAVGGKVHVSVPECGIDGYADVLTIRSCPPVAGRSGRVVTGVFRHSSAHVLDLYIEGLDRPIGTTANHLFWSEDRREFVRADALMPGEELRRRSGTARVARAVPRSERHAVYNIEIHREHVYHVGRSGILSHNPGDCLDFAHEMLQQQPDGVIFQMEPSQNPGGWMGGEYLPGYPVPGQPAPSEFIQHFFHLQDGILMDPGNPGGIPIEQWLQQLAENAEMAASEVLDWWHFTPIIP